jgi:HEAT repeat protein
MSSSWKLTAAAWLGLALTAVHGDFLDRPLRDWLDDLEKGKTTQSRRAAAFAIGRMGPLGAPGIDSLARRLRDDDEPLVRDMAAQALGEVVLGSGETVARRAWESAGSILKRRLAEEREARVRRSIVYALGAIGESARPALPEIREALRDKAPSVRQNAAWALGRIGAGASELRQALRDSDALVRRDAAHALGQIARAKGRDAVKDAGHELIRMASKEKDGVARNTALAALASIAGKEHAEACDALHPLLDSRDGDTRRATAFALAAAGGEHLKKALPVLEEALLDGDPSVQALAAAGLAGVGKEADAAAPALARALEKSTDPIVRRNCAIALGQIGERGGEVAALALAAALKPRSVRGADAEAQEDEVRHMAAEALSHIGFPANRKAVPAIKNAIAGDRHFEVRLRCVEALFRASASDLNDLGVTRVLEKVLEETGEEGVLVRYNCARLLAKTFADKAPPRSVDVLMHMLHNRKIKVFYETGASVEGGPTEANKGTTSTAARTGGDARFMAAEALGWLGPLASENKEVVEALRKATSDDDSELRKKASEALKSLKIK